MRRFPLRSRSSNPTRSMPLLFPGGFFYVNSGLILAADDEAELAGVMAHEIAHVAARHGAENASKAQLRQYRNDSADLPRRTGRIRNPPGCGFSDSDAVPAILAKAESEADYLGLQYLYKTGYDPGAAVSFFEKLQAKETAKPGTISKMFSTHPPTGDRIEKTKKNIELVLPDREQYVVTTSEFQKIKRQLANWKTACRTRKNKVSPSLKRKTTTRTTDDADDEVEDTQRRSTNGKPNRKIAHRQMTIVRC